MPNIEHNPVYQNGHQRTHVVVAVLFNQQNEILISQRHTHSHQGGLWEFPGGKVEPGEEAYPALCRELMEELGVTVESARALIQIPHDYPDRQVLLDVYLVIRWSGTPRGRENQKIAWVSQKILQDYAFRAHKFPVADLPIITAIHLPDTYLITPEPSQDTDSFLRALGKCLDRGTRLVQFRAKQLHQTKYEELARKVLVLCNAKGAKCLLNGEPTQAKRIGMHGVHLTSQQLLAIEKTRLQSTDDSFLIGASCHNRKEIEHACRIGADFAVIAPVKATQTHPDVKPLTWNRFAELTRLSTIPVYALGGLSLTDMEMAWKQGAQGIAAIRALWFHRNRKETNLAS